MIGVCNSQPYGEAKLCYVLKFVGGSVGRGGFQILVVLRRFP